MHAVYLITLKQESCFGTADATVLESTRCLFPFRALQGRVKGRVKGRVYGRVKGRVKRLTWTLLNTISHTRNMS